MLDKVRTGHCFHCQAPLPPGEAIALEKAGETRQFCCHGCVAAAELIETLHLDSFYRFREQCAVDAPVARPEKTLPWEEFTACVQRLPDGTQELRLFIPDIRCATCVWLLEQVLSKQTGVLQVHLNFAKRRLRVVCRDGADLPALLTRIRELGYTPLPDRADQVRQSLDTQKRSMLIRLGVAGIGMMPVMMFALASYLAGPPTAQNLASGMDPLYETLLRWASLAISVPVVFFSASPFHRGAWAALRHRSLSMDLPVSLAILAAWSLSVANTLSFRGAVYFDTACMFTFFLLIGRYIELLSRQHFQDNEDSLLRLLPGSVTRVQHDNGRVLHTETILLADVRPDDVLQVQAGDAIPADGVVVAGSSSVSDAAFTGEPYPSFRSPGSRVLAGALNHDGALLVRATSAPQDVLIAQIGRLYDQASSYKPRWSLLADRAASWFIALVLGLSAAAGGYWYLAGSPDYFVIALTVLVVACPCALSLATPVASTIATTTLRSRGLLIRHGAFLERLAGTSAVVFDKTGTLTQARLMLERVEPLSTVDASTCLAIATALEQHSKHPIAQAFDTATTLRATQVQRHEAGGLEGQIDSITYRIGTPAFAMAGAPALQAPSRDGLWILLADDKPLAWLQLRDRMRADAPDLIDTFRRQGMHTAIFSGDASEDGKALAGTLHTDELRTGMSPQDKIDAIRQLGTSRQVLMVGDGVNDAGAMAAASTSIAIAPQDVVVQQSADATLLSPSLALLPDILAFARRCRRIIRQNVLWSLLYNLAAIPLALAGLLPPWLAAIGMSLSSVLVVANASRLRRMEG